MARFNGLITDVAEPPGQIESIPSASDAATHRFGHRVVILGTNLFKRTVNLFRSLRRANRHLTQRIARSRFRKST